MMKIHSHILGGTVVLSGLFATGLAQAQDAPPAPAPPAAEPAPAAPAPPPPAAEPAPPAAAAEPAPAPEPMPIAEPAPEAAPADNPFKITVGGAVRAGLRIQNVDKPADDGNYTKLNDQFMDELNAELRVSGKVTDIIGWTANFTVDGRTRAQAGGITDGGSIKFQAQALDLIGQLDFMDEFHIWMGRMLTPSDRSNFSGAWFMAPWNYSGVIDGYYGPRGTEEAGREVGVTVWGDVNKGKFKYYLGLLDLDSNAGSVGGSPLQKASYAAQNPLLSARVQYAFVGAEPGFYGSSTYYGGQDIVAVGAAFQYQKDYRVPGGPGNPDVKDNLTEFNADILAEFKTGAGTPGIEAAYYHESGDTRGFDDFFYILPGFTTGEILPANGKLNATFRFQMVKAGKDTPGEKTAMAIEPSVAYLFKDYFAKLQLTYSYLKAKYEDNRPDWKQQFIQLGFQIQQ